MTETFDYFREDTIAALSTPAGRGAIAIIRVSGPAAFSLVHELCPSLSHESQKPRQASLTRIMASGEVIDEALVTLFPAPHSYSGEDVAEISCHGGCAVVRAILGRLCQRGARLAGPGEFTFRAVRNGKLDTIQAQGICDLIDASTERLRRAAFSSFDGSLTESLSPLESRLVDIAVRLEACIEFPDDVPEDEAGVKDEEIAQVLQSILRIERSALNHRLLTDGLRLVLIGQPNVGKSSLFNRLVGRERAIVSPHPGTTRDTIEATVEIAGLPVTLVDTAGLHDRPGEVEALGIARTRDAAQTGDGLLLVTEATRTFDTTERHIIESPDKPLLVILNKTDLVSDPLVSASTRAVPVSALTGTGLETLWHAIEELIDQLLPRQGQESQVLLSALQETQLRQTREALERAMEAHARQEPEIVAEDIRSALACLARLRGTGLTPDLVGEMFSRFCVGK